MAMSRSSQRCRKSARSAGAFSSVTTRRSTMQREARQQVLDEIAEDVDPWSGSIGRRRPWSGRRARRCHRCGWPRGRAERTRLRRRPAARCEGWDRSDVPLSTRESITTRIGRTRRTGASGQTCSDAGMRALCCAYKIVAEKRPKTMKLRAVGGRRWLRWALFASLSAAALGLVVLVGLFLIFSADPELPRIDAVADYRPKVVSKVMSSDGELIGEIYEERRTVVPRDKIPPVMIHAHRRRRGRAVLRARRPQLLGHVPRARRRPEAGRAHAGRLDADAAAGAQPHPQELHARGLRGRQAQGAGDDPRASGSSRSCRRTRSSTSI